MSVEARLRFLEARYRQVLGAQAACERRVPEKLPNPADVSLRPCAARRFGRSRCCSEFRAR
jgi:hypothetical protein